MAKAVCYLETLTMVDAAAGSPKAMLPRQNGNKLSCLTVLFKALIRISFRKTKLI